MSSKDNLNILIEQIRQRLNYLISKTEDLTSPEVIKLSKELDEVLNNYNKVNQ